MSALEALLRWFSGLSVQSVDVPNYKVPSNSAPKLYGANTARRLRAKYSFGGKLSPTRYTGSQSQTRVRRRSDHAPEDVAASLSNIKDRTTQKLVLYLVLPWWENDVPALFRGLLRSYLQESESRRWHADALKINHVEAMIALALTELRNETACKACNTGGETFDHVAGWSECTRCDGTGYILESQRTRWAKLNTQLAPFGVNVTHYQYRTRWDEPYTWLLTRIYDLLDTAWEEVRA